MHLMFWGKETNSEACTGNSLAFNNAVVNFLTSQNFGYKSSLGNDKTKISDLDSVQNLLQTATDTELYLSPQTWISIHLRCIEIFICILISIYHFERFVCICH